MARGGSEGGGRETESCARQGQLYSTGAIWEEINRKTRACFLRPPFARFCKSMPQVLYVGNFTRKVDQKHVQIINTRGANNLQHFCIFTKTNSDRDRVAAETENVTSGTHVRRWDYVTEVDEDLLPPSKLKHLRHRSDKLADDVVEYLNLKPGVDSLRAIEEHLASTTEPKSRAVVDFWAAVNMEPPREVSAFSTVLGDGDKKERAIEECTPGEAMEKNDGKAAATLANGQAVFWRYSSSIFGALLHFSLAGTSTFAHSQLFSFFWRFPERDADGVLIVGGFTSPNLSAVMQETNYLTSDSLNATYYRLLETSLFVGDAMRDMRIGSGKGWRSAIRVRLLHAQVRLRIKSKRGKFNVYDEEVSGIPINQEDLCAVLGSFMIAPIWSMERAGIHLTEEERSAYQAAWRHVGYALSLSSLPGYPLMLSCADSISE